MQCTIDRCPHRSPADQRDELLARMRRVESFNRSVSHDLRGPLAGLSGLTQLTAAALRHGDTASAAALLASASRQLSMLIDTVDSLLALASASEVPLARSDTDLTDCARQALELVRGSLAHKVPGARMPDVHIAPLPRAVVDARMMRQVFANLLCNAAKFSLPVPAPRVEVGSLAKPGGVATLYVRDNGVGFDPELAARLFQPFHRLHGARFHGSGLGLSIVRSAVERHGGRAWIESAPGIGTTVFFTIGSRP